MRSVSVTHMTLGATRATVEWHAANTAHHSRSGMSLGAKFPTTGAPMIATIAVAAAAAFLVAGTSSPPVTAVP